MKLSSYRWYCDIIGPTSSIDSVLETDFGLSARLLLRQLSAVPFRDQLSVAHGSRRELSDKKMFD